MDIFYRVLILCASALPTLLVIRWIPRFDFSDTGPRFLVSKLFILGLISPAVAALIEFVSIPLVAFLPPGLIVPAQAFLGIALVEETVKMTAMMLILRRLRQVKDLSQGLVYGMTVAMGFALVENILYMTGSAETLNVAMMRVFTALPLHVLTGAVMGFFWARFKMQSRGSVYQALLLAIVIHGSYDWVLRDNRIPDSMIWVILLIGWFLLSIALHRNRNLKR